MSIIAFLLACYGLCFLLRDSLIAQPVRAMLVARSDFLASMLECAFCTGFWCSLAMTVMVFPLSAANIACLPLAGATICLFLDKILTSIENNILIQDRSVYLRSDNSE